MEEELEDREATQIFCCKLRRKSQWVWLYTLVPSALSFLLHLTSLLVDSTLALQLALTDCRLDLGLLTFTFVYVPVAFTLVLQPLPLPQRFSCSSLFWWTLRLVLYFVFYPLLMSLSLLKRLFWILQALQTQKPCKEILTEYDTVLSKDEHSYVFLQAFLHCGAQAILQTHLLLLKMPIDLKTEYLQAASVLVSLVTLAYCVASYHRYEAQVVGGRPPVLLLNPPELTSGTQDITLPLLPIRFCLRSKIIALQMDSLEGKVVLFFSWLLLISGRLMCLVISQIMHQKATVVTLLIHFCLILLYLFSSLTTTLYDIPSRLVNAIFSIVTLVEVSVRFHKIALLYFLFFICIFVEDTYLMILFYVYNKDRCSDRGLDCDSFGMYAYFIINSHVLGIILFGLFLARLRPQRKSVVSMPPAENLVSS
uniref:XK-related protein n=1 Tax=Graphocephala atropunctata TaxID=36148 RepID=A0A1B6LZJ8_9HEMI